MIHGKHEVTELLIPKLPALTKIHVLPYDKLFCGPHRVGGRHLQEQEPYLPGGFLCRDLPRTDHDDVLWLDSNPVPLWSQCGARIGTQAESCQKGGGRDLRRAQVFHLEVLQLDTRPGRASRIMKWIDAGNDRHGSLRSPITNCYPVARHRNSLAPDLSRLGASFLSARSPILLSRRKRGLWLADSQAHISLVIWGG